jgi:putative transposase
MERGEAAEGGRQRDRNGYRPGRVTSAEGAIDYSAPQIADRREPFRSRIREVVRGRTEELEALAVAMYARGLSTRDIEAVFADADGGSLLSRTAVSEVTERLWAEYEAFVGRDLSHLPVCRRHRRASRTCAGAACPTRWWWPATGRPA